MTRLDYPRSGSWPQMDEMLAGVAYSFCPPPRAFCSDARELVDSALGMEDV